MVVGHVAPSSVQADYHWAQDSAILREAADDISSVKALLAVVSHLPSHMSLSHSFVIKCLLAGASLVGTCNCSEGET